MGLRSVSGGGWGCWILGTLSAGCPPRDPPDAPVTVPGQFWVQLSSAIVGGLAVATFITILLTPALCELVSAPRSRDAGNSLFRKSFPGGQLVMTGANSAVGLRCR